MAEYQQYSYDVLVIGAGGAGLRAAIEAAASGVKVGVVCKSLLGKAHTVMAEGGVAAALANVDDRDSWRVHFADTMRGGQYLNNWRMAEIHAKEAPERVRELEAWGALFDRTKDGRILQRNFGGHRYPTARARWRSHRPGNDPDTAGPRHPSGHGSAHGMHRSQPADGLGPDRRRFRLRPRKGPLHYLDGESGRARHWRHRASVQSDQQQLGIHGRWPRARLPRRGRTARHGIRPVPSNGHGVADQRPRHSRDRGRTRRGRCPAQQRGPPLHVRRHSRPVQRLRPPTRKKKAGGIRRATRMRGVRPSC